MPSTGTAPRKKKETDTEIFNRISNAQNIVRKEGHAVYRAPVAADIGVQIYHDIEHKEGEVMESDLNRGAVVTKKVDGVFLGREAVAGLCDKDILTLCKNMEILPFQAWIKNGSVFRPWGKMTPDQVAESQDNDFLRSVRKNGLFISTGKSGSITPEMKEAATERGLKVASFMGAFGGVVGGLGMVGAMTQGRFVSATPGEAVVVTLGMAAAFYLAGYFGAVVNPPVEVPYEDEMLAKGKDPKSALNETISHIFRAPRSSPSPRV